MKLAAALLLTALSCAAQFGQIPGPSGGGAPSGPAGGSLTGTYPNPGLSASAVAAASCGYGLTTGNVLIGQLSGCPTAPGDITVNPGVSVTVNNPLLYLNDQSATVNQFIAVPGTTQSNNMQVQANSKQDLANTERGGFWWASNVFNIANNQAVGTGVTNRNMVITAGSILSLDAVGNATFFHLGGSTTQTVAIRTGGYLGLGTSEDANICRQGAGIIEISTSSTCNNSGGMQMANLSVGGGSIGSNTAIFQNTTPTTGVSIVTCKDGAGQSTTACIQVAQNGGTVGLSLASSGTITSANGVIVTGGKTCTLNTTTGVYACV